MLLCVSGWQHISVAFCCLYIYDDNAIRDSYKTTNSLKVFKIEETPCSIVALSRNAAITICHSI